MLGENHGEAPLLIGVTGASGALIPRTLLGLVAAQARIPAEVIFTTTAEEVWEYELGETVPQGGVGVVRYANDDLFAPPASGSHPTLGMVIAPCSMGTLGKIAHGIADCLLTRSADVALKEGRPLILVPRETPLSPIHLENMLRLSRMGAVIMPPMLTMYGRPDSLEEMVEDFAQHILERLGLPAMRKAWGGKG